MISIRKWFFSKMLSPSNISKSMFCVNNLIVQFYYADEELNLIAAELDSFDGRKDPIRCTTLVNQLRAAQDKVITYIFRLMAECHCETANRDYRLKFPDDLLTGEGAESLNGQIWFGAECLAAGSNIMNHESESAFLRPMAKSLTTTLDQLRQDLRNCHNDFQQKPNLSLEMICKLENFDRLFSSFEYEYVKAMLPIKTADEIEKQHEVTVLFSEALSNAVRIALVSQDDIDDCQPKVMIAIPRLAIVTGLLQGEGSAICKKSRDQLSNLFKPFHTLLLKIRDLLIILRPIEIEALQRLLTNEEVTTTLSNDKDSLNDVSINMRKQKRSNSAPNINHIQFSNSKFDLKCASTVSLMTCLSEISNNLNNIDDKLSVTSVESSATTTGSIDSFEIALALGAKNSQYIPAQTKLLLHKLFITIAGIADQLQSNYAGDLRNILRNVFTLSRSVEDDNISVEEAVEAKEFIQFSDLTIDSSENEDQTDGMMSRSTTITNDMSSHVSINVIDHMSGVDVTSESDVTEQTDLSRTTSHTPHTHLMPPIWVPDELVSVCTICALQFTLIRRRHHCRKCGQIYCNSCSNHFIPIACYGFLKPVRVCNNCYQQTQRVSITQSY